MEYLVGTKLPKLILTVTMKRSKLIFSMAMSYQREEDSLKLQYKAAMIMSLFGGGLILLLSASFHLQNSRTVIDNELDKILEISETISTHLDSDINGKISIAKTITTAPTIKDILRESNKEFSSFTNEQRNSRIDSLNQRWMKAKSINDPFIQVYLRNTVGVFLKNQQLIMPKMYGEIFLTNRFGVLVGTTGKLTTLAHGHKYWWTASYHDGEGRIFLDDRGFDISVDGYVLGIVVPVKDGDEIIGILKCNVNIESILTHSIEEHGQNHPGKFQISRTGGLVVREPEFTPLSTQIPESIHGLLQEKRKFSTIISVENSTMLVAIAPVQVTLGSNEVGFGGKKETIDQIYGNQGEAWSIVVSVSEEDALIGAKNTTKKTVLAGFIFLFFASVISMILGRLIARPIVDIARVATKIGLGNLQSRIKISSSDEVGSLAISFNVMAENIETQVHEKEKVIKDLQNALDEISTLRGIIPICSYCKRIRNDQGAWDIIEAYISTHSEAEFSHGICPKCYEEQIDEIENE